MLDRVGKLLVCAKAYNHAVYEPGLACISLDVMAL